MKPIRTIATGAFLFAALFFLPAVAHADNYITYDLDGTFQSGGTLTGYFTLDETPWGAIDISDAQIVADGDTFSCPDGFANGCVVGSGNSANYEFLSGPGDNGSFFVEVAWPGNQTNDYTITLSPGATYCDGCVSGLQVDYLTSGTATDPPPAPPATPEPSSLAMLFAGLAMLGFIGRKSRSALQS